MFRDEARKIHTAEPFATPVGRQPRVSAGSIFGISTLVRVLQTYSKHSFATKALVDLRLKAESEHRAPELNDSTRGTARQLRPDEVDDLVASYETVRNIRQIANAFGLYRGTVREHLKRRGIEVCQVCSMAEREMAQAVELYETGHSSVIVGQKLGFSNHTILNTLRAAGAEVRKQPGRR